jgi:hypothetical protein
VDVAKERVAETERGDGEAGFERAAREASHAAR